VRRIAEVVLGSAVLVGACGEERTTGEADPPVVELTVFAASSLTDAFAEVGRAFEAGRADVTVTFSFGASSSLREQILEGAPADVFASASPGPVTDLEEAGEVEDAEVFASNRLQLAVPAGNPGGVRGIEDLGRDELLVGLCAPEVPCGTVATEVLAAAGVDAAPDTQEADVRALLTKLEEAELDAGLVYATDVLAADGAVEGIDLPDGVGGRTDYPIAVVADTDDRAVADAFVAFVVGEEGQAILRRYGFGAA